MNTLLESLSNLQHNERGALTRETTNSAVLDFFGKSGGFRGAKTLNKDIIEAFDKAFAEDKNLALKALFYTRDVRGGQGERNVFRVILQHLATKNPNVVIGLLGQIPEYGRWDDLIHLLMTPLDEQVSLYLKDRFLADLSKLNFILGGGQPKYPLSLLAKWLPSENASSKNTKFLAGYIRTKFGMSAKEYRKNLSALRKEINVLERQLCSNEWGKVNYSHVPSRAGLIYRKAFYKHDEERYAEFVNAATKGEAKVNTKVLFPYELIAPFFTGGMTKHADTNYYCDTRTQSQMGQQEAALDMLWRNLPNYFEDKTENSLVICDTSGSMRGLPVQVAISLAIYTAERNKGPFHNHFITFSEHPQLQSLKGETIGDKVRNLSNVGWANNTNLMAVFDLILNRAFSYRVKKEDMPNRVYIVSDFQFDQARLNTHTNFEEMQNAYAKYGYKMPEVVFWNVRAAAGQPATKQDNVKIVSGCSPSIFKTLLSGKSKTAYELMLETLLNKRYEPIKA